MSLYLEPPFDARRFIKEHDAGEYEICRRRGHQSDEGYVYLSNPPQAKCKWCGRFYRYEIRTELVETVKLAFGGGDEGAA